MTSMNGHGYQVGICQILFYATTYFMVKKVKSEDAIFQYEYYYLAMHRDPMDFRNITCFGSKFHHNIDDKLSQISPKFMALQNRGIRIFGKGP